MANYGVEVTQRKINESFIAAQLIGEYELFYLL